MMQKNSKIYLKELGAEGDGNEGSYIQPRSVITSKIWISPTLSG